MPKTEDKLIIVYAASTTKTSKPQSSTSGEYSKLIKELSDIRNEYNQKVSDLRKDYYDAISTALADIRKIRDDIQNTKKID